MPGEAYPQGWEADVELDDGSSLRLRPIRHDEGGALLGHFARLSPASRYLRFFSPKQTLSASEVERFTHVDYADRMAMVAVPPPAAAPSAPAPPAEPDPIIAVARYDRARGTTRAEVAFAVDDAHQGLGLGHLLLEFLADYARSHGIVEFEAETLPNNRPMLEVFHHAGYPVVEHFDGSALHVCFPITPTLASDAVLARIARRAAGGPGDQAPPAPT
jgi:GNAT superfamily N-acetyltransferase